MPMRWLNPSKKKKDIGGMMGAYLILKEQVCKEVEHGSTTSANPVCPKEKGQ